MQLPCIGVLFYIAWMFFYRWPTATSFVSYCAQLHVHTLLVSTSCAPASLPCVSVFLQQGCSSIGYLYSIFLLLVYSLAKSATKSMLSLFMLQQANDKPIRCQCPILAGIFSGFLYGLYTATQLHVFPLLMLFVPTSCRVFLCGPGLCSNKLLALRLSLPGAWASVNALLQQESSYTQTSSIHFVQVLCFVASSTVLQSISLNSLAAGPIHNCDIKLATKIGDTYPLGCA